MRTKVHSVIEVLTRLENCSRYGARFLSRSGKPTFYEYKDGTITMSERTTEHENSISSYNEGLDDLVRWLGKLKILSPPVTGLTEYQLDLRYEGDTLQHTYYLNQKGKGKIGKKKNILMKSCFDVTTNRLTFFPRPKLEINYMDFRMAITHAQYFAEQIKNIVKATQ